MSEETPVVLILETSPVMGGRCADLRDLVGMSGASAENELSSRGYVNVGCRIDGDAVWTWWWNQPRGHCVTVVAREGRAASVVSEPPAPCPPALIAGGGTMAADADPCEGLRFRSGAALAVEPDT